VGVGGEVERGLAVGDHSERAHHPFLERGRVSERRELGCLLAEQGVEPGHARPLAAHMEVGHTRLVDHEFDTVLCHSTSQAPTTDNRPGRSRVSLMFTLNG
jgi:hypothetical protein